MHGAGRAQAQVARDGDRGAGKVGIALGGIEVDVLPTQGAAGQAGLLVAGGFLQLAAYAFARLAETDGIDLGAAAVEAKLRR